MNDIILWLQSWFASQCGDDWEYENIISITTTSNPGWGVDIDLVGTSLENFELPYNLIEVSDNDWLGYAFKNNKFSGAGDPTKLTKILEIFREWAESK
jgi:hypothetical protein